MTGIRQLSRRRNLVGAGSYTAKGVTWMNWPSKIASTRHVGAVSIFTFRSDLKKNFPEPEEEVGKNSNRFRRLLAQLRPRLI